MKKDGADVESKQRRLMAIKEIIRTRKISSQQNLMDALVEKGFSFTQATLSRDLKHLNVGKVPDSTLGYIYIINESEENMEELIIGNTSSVSAFLSIEFSGNLAVVKTLPAFASSIASLIDSLNIYGVMGTIAGDDNILLVLREGISPADIKNSLLVKLPELKNKL